MSTTTQIGHFPIIVESLNDPLLIFNNKYKVKSFYFDSSDNYSKLFGVRASEVLILELIDTTNNSIGYGKFYADYEFSTHGHMCDLLLAKIETSKEQCYIQHFDNGEDDVKCFLKLFAPNSLINKFHENDPFKNASYNLRNLMLETAAKKHCETIGEVYQEINKFLCNMCITQTVCKEYNCIYIIVKPDGVCRSCGEQLRHLPFE